MCVFCIYIWKRQSVQDEPAMDSSTHSHSIALLSSTFFRLAEASRVSVLSPLSIILRIRSSYVHVIIDCT